MNYRTLVKGAFALSLSLIVGAASAEQTTYNDVQKYGATFETTANTPAGAFNDYDYEVGSNVTAYADATTGVGWFSGEPEQDESKIVARTDAAGGQALQLNTDASTLTNKFSSTLAGELNTGIAAAGAYFETEVKFVPSDTNDAGITGGQDATKFAIYAYANEDANPPVTNLVVYHAYVDLDSPTGINYTNDVTDITIDANVYAKLRVEMKQVDLDGEDTKVNAFCVKIDNGDGTVRTVTTPTAFDETNYGVASGNWFLTVEKFETDINKEVSSLNFKGTGEIDNIKAGVIEGTTTYAIDWTGSQGVAVTNAAGTVLANADTNFEANASIYFTANALPEGNVITNVFVGGTPIDGITFPVAEYAYTVGAADTTVTVLAGVPAQEPSQTKPAWAADSGDGSQSDPYWAWATAHAAGQTLDAEGADFSAQYLMNVDANVTPVLKIDSIVVTDEGSQIVVSATDGTTAINLAQINGVLNVLVGTEVGSLTKKAIPAANVRFADNVATIIIPAADGKFIKASVDYAAGATSLTAVAAGE